MIYYSEILFNTVGTLILASLNEKLIYLGINNSDLNDFADKLQLNIKKDINSNPKATEQLKEYFAAERKHFDLETEFLSGTKFQQSVWRELRNIPYGQVISYKELAARVNKPGACRAVGNANSKNPIPVIFPCHRVINSNGGLGGFSCGLNVKKFLLDLEIGDIHHLLSVSN